MSKVIAYVCTLCPFAQRTRITLNIKSIPYEVVAFDNDILLKKKPKPQILLDKNPNAAVPVIDHGDLTLYESAIIGEYLDEAFEGIQLLPSNVQQRALARLVINQSQSKFITPMYSYMFNTDVTKEEELKNKLIDGLKWTENEFNKHTGEYFLGDNVSLVDISLVPFVERLDVAFAPLKNENFLEQYSPNVANWYRNTMHKLEGYTQTKEDADYLIEAYKEYLNPK
jgi:glutathione S-transferase